MIPYGDLFVCIGKFFMMTIIKGLQRHDFWIISTIYPFKMDPYYFNVIPPWTNLDSTLK